MAARAKSVWTPRRRASVMALATWLVALVASAAAWGFGGGPGGGSRAGGGPTGVDVIGRAGLGPTLPARP
jgi:hypothetical protein